MPRILLVEDNELNREMLSRRLLRKGFDVVLAVDGLQGVALATTERPDLVLMDMSLPGIDGWEATRRLRADPATQALPVIALTAHAMSDDRAKALAAGCDDFDTKPVALDRLLGKMQALLAAAQAADTQQPTGTIQPAGTTQPTQPTQTDGPDRPPNDPAPPQPGALLWFNEQQVLAVPASLPGLQAALDALCRQAAVGQALRADLFVVLDEVCANIFKHAYAPQAPGRLGVSMRLLGADPADPVATAWPRRIELGFNDQGRRFNPLDCPAPDLGLPATERPIGGLGIHLVRQLTDRQHHSWSPEQGNRLTLVKHLPEPSPSERPGGARA